MCILQRFGGIYLQRAAGHGEVMRIDKVFAAEIECRHAVFLMLSSLLSATARTDWKLYGALVLSRFVEIDGEAGILHFPP